MYDNIKSYLKDSKSNSFDNLMIAVSLIEPVLNIPQVIQLYSVKNAVSLSLTTWVFYVATTVLWFVWGWKRKLKAIWISQVFWILIEIAMIYGIIIY